MNKLLSAIIVILCIIIVAYSFQTSELLDQKTTLMQKFVLLAKQKQQVKIVTEKVYVTSVPELNSKHLEDDSPCLNLIGKEEFTDQWGNQVFVDWSQFQWAKNVTEMNTFLDNRINNSGASTCYDAYFILNDVQYHVTRNHRFMRLN